jgi:hypothetical protein
VTNFNGRGIVGFTFLLALGLGLPRAAERETVAGQGRVSKPAAGATAAQVEIEAGLVIKAGNVQKGARTEFQLVRQSVVAILMENDTEGYHHAGAGAARAGLTELAKNSGQSWRTKVWLDRTEPLS